MSKDKLIVNEDRHYRYVLDWFLDDEQEIGGRIGQNWKKKLHVIGPRMSLDLVEHFIAENVASTSKGVEFCGDDFVWESKKDAVAALAAIKAAWKVHASGVPWPSWAETALANGWKAPKGWKP